MKYSLFSIKTLILLFSLTLTACGGGSSDDGSEVSTGIFIDSPVVNIGYRTATQEGVTNFQGEYSYLPGETVTFFIGDLELPSVAASGIVTVLDIADANDTSDPTVVNISRLLQTLDKDGNLDNGIEITEGAKSAAAFVEFEVSVAVFEANTDIINLINNGGQDTPVTTLISESDAIAHLEEQLEAIEVSNGSIVGAWAINGADSGDLAIWVFYADGRYLQYVNQPARSDCSTGGEGGTYTFDGSTLSYNKPFDDNNECGMGPGTGTGTLSNTTVDGDTLSIVGGEATFSRINQDNSIVGAWAINGADSGDLAIWVFYADGRYLQYVNQPARSDCSTGGEGGTYTFDGSTLSYNKSFDDNNECGMGPDTGPGTVSNTAVDGDTLSIVGGEATFSRI